MRNPYFSRINSREIVPANGRRNAAGVCGQDLTRAQGLCGLPPVTHTAHVLARYDYRQHNGVIRDVPVAPSRFGDVVFV